MATGTYRTIPIAKKLANPSSSQNQGSLPDCQPVLQVQVGVVVVENSKLKSSELSRHFKHLVIELSRRATRKKSYDTIFQDK